MSIENDSTPVSETPNLIIRINGAIMNEAYSLWKAKIRHTINSIPYAEISILIDLDSDQSEDFNPGDVIEIIAGYAETLPVSIFSGVIVSHSLHIDGDINAIRIICKHQAIRMTYNIRDRLFTSMKDHEAMKMILDEYALLSTIEASADSEEIIRQYQMNDWDFIMKRCSMNGFMVHIQANNTISIKRPGLSDIPKLRLTLGLNIISFEGSLNAEFQPSNIQWRSWDEKNQQVISASGTEPVMNQQGNISAGNLSASLSQSSQQFYTSTPQSENNLKKLADSELLLKRLHSITGKVSIQGNNGILPGDLIEIDGVGAKLSGQAFVSGITHTFNEGQWISTIYFGLPERKFQSQTALNPGSQSFSNSGSTSGLQLARVKSIENDPQNKQRILIEIPTNTGLPDLVWARMSHFNASDRTGSFFIPEIGDEVVIGYLENESAYPVILGALYNGQHESPYPMLDTNPVKAFVTRNKLKIEFDDEKNKISLSTPGNNKIVLNDHDGSIELIDQHNQLIRMNGDGIFFNSASDITLKANGKINLNAMTDLTLNSQANLNLNALNIHAGAQLEMNLQGSASAGLSSSGMTEIKGAMVMIN